MNGNTTAGARDKHLRLLLTYKGSADAGDDIRDDYLYLALKPDAAPEALACAVLNFPLFQGDTILFLHDLQPYEGEEEMRKLLLETAETFAKKQGYRDIYINTARMAPDFLERLGFQEIPGRLMAVKHLKSGETLP